MHYVLQIACSWGSCVEGLGFRYSSIASYFGCLSALWGQLQQQVCGPSSKNLGMRQQQQQLRSWL